ncbi:adipocyte plasma membrane-associated protein Hemomucin isoform X1 [Anopheles ziemanni]|uniref:adipocyte plasma membrane-associated protein Hemomucin-like isoform X1 n=1 Tax=Anopheles coustani TaxID=139045 RepID=UPI0026582A08|nr:adipocyte plasma membrane-associated protein Hemomucin-like isoform X1 [Anopheles coustani]XP_058175277.1 adipocyte plasma membrane-associated protein Hemomucin isoform X1 [Anopheles ziemanni]
MGLLRVTRTRIINFLGFFFLIVLLPGLPPKTTFPFEGFSFAKPRELKGALEPTNHLDNAERLFEGKIYGPEALLVRGKDLFTTIHGGEVIRINGDHITHIAKFGKPCELSFEEETCGRPLGLAFDTKGSNLIVGDAYYGIWLVDLTNGNKELLVSPDTMLEGKGVNRKAKFFNSVVVARNGDIFWTDSSSDFTLQDGVFAVFANPSGRLFKYDRATGKNKVLLDRLYFANGVALSPDEEFVLVAETMASQIRRYYLKGPKAGTDDIFIDGLPGMIDNLISDAEGIWAPLIQAADNENPSITQMMSSVPLIRKFIIRMLALAELPMRLIHQVVPNVHTQRLIHAIGHFESMSFLTPSRQTLVKIGWTGRILGSLHGFDGTVGSVSHVAEMGDYLYLGSPYNKFLARVPLPKIPKVEVRDVKYKPATETTVPPKATTTTTTTTPKPVTTTTTTPKPTTTTPKPTTTTTTPKPATTTTTTTPKPATTTTTTTPKPATTTTTPKPATSTTTTPKPTTTTTPKPKTTATPKAQKPTETPKPSTEVPAVEKKKETKPSAQSTKPSTEKPATEKPVDPAPIHEKIPNDTPKPKEEKLKVIKKGGEHGEL